LDTETLKSYEFDSKKSEDVAFKLLLDKYHKINAVFESNKTNRNSSAMKVIPIQAKQLSDHTEPLVE
jgi:hypothetical protein